MCSSPCNASIPASIQHFALSKPFIYLYSGSIFSVNNIARVVLQQCRFSTQFLMQFSLLQDICGVLLKTLFKLEMNSLRMTDRKFFVHFSCTLIFTLQLFIKAKNISVTWVFFRDAARRTDNLASNYRKIMQKYSRQNAG